MKSLVCLFAAALVPVALWSQELTVAVRGQPAAYSIVRPANASPSQIHAAGEFQKFTEQMTGVKLPVIADDAPLPARAMTAPTVRLLIICPAAATADDYVRIFTRRVIPSTAVTSTTLPAGRSASAIAGQLLSPTRTCPRPLTSAVSSVRR